MFKSLRERLAGWKQEAEADVTSEAIGDSGKKIKEDKLEEVLYDLEIALLESDVAFPVAKEIVDRLADDLKGKRIARDVGLAKGVEAALRDALLRFDRELPAAARAAPAWGQVARLLADLGLGAEERQGRGRC